MLMLRLFSFLPSRVTDSGPGLRTLLSPKHPCDVDRSICTQWELRESLVPFHQPFCFLLQDEEAEFTLASGDGQRKKAGDQDLKLV